MGAGFYLLEIPLVFFWSVPFLLGGVLMIGASFLMSESPGPIRPPAGFRFCVFCSSPVPLSSDRCPQCNGLQPGEGP